MPTAVSDPAPAYERRGGHMAGPNTQHTFTQHESEIGLAITFYSEAANPGSTPTFHDGACVFGTVQVSFRKKRKMDSISVKLHGYQKIDQLQWLDQEEKEHDRVFLALTETLWPPPGSSRESSMAPGTYNFPFSFNFPRETTNLGRSGSTYPLPPSFSPQYFTDHLIYEVVAVARRGGFFREDEFLITPVRFVPRPVAGVPSPSRVLAYKHSQPLQGPTQDPAGWKIEQLVMNGKLYGRTVEVTCDLALAAPLDYPRGFPIPFRLIMRSNDEQALAAFSALGAMSVALNRMVVRFKRARDSEGAKNKVVANGECWVDNENKQQYGVEELHGELHVPLSLGPSFNYKTLSMLYSVTLAPAVPGFDFGKEMPMLTVPVQVAYFPPGECKPRSYAPPAGYTEHATMSAPAVRQGDLVTVV